MWGQPPRLSRRAMRGGFFTTQWRRADYRPYDFPMLPFCLYFVAGVVTGYHVYTLLALTVYGAPFNPLELLSVVGSLCLVIAAYISLYKPYAAARLALLASLVIWGFYGPAIAKSIRTKFDKQNATPHAQLLVTPQEPRKIPAAAMFLLQHESSLLPPDLK